MTFPVRISALAYVPGYVFFVQDSTLFARPFDEQRLAFSGEPIRMVDGVPSVGTRTGALLGIRRRCAGVLAVSRRDVVRAAVVRQKRPRLRAVGTPALYAGFALSPDASRLAFSRAGKRGGADVWVRDLARGGESRLTFDGAAFIPQWSPDGTRIVFTGPGEKPPIKLFIKNVANAGPAMSVGVSRRCRISRRAGAETAASSSACGSIRPAATICGFIAWTTTWTNGCRSTRPSMNRTDGVSPDSRWIAYDTDASGKSEVWVASFPSGVIRRQVSSGGGISPEWGDGSAEIVYLSDDKRLMSTRVAGTQTTIDVAAPRPLFPIENLADIDQFNFPTSNAYLAASNGERFLVAVRAPDPNAPPINIVVNWRALLRR